MKIKSFIQRLNPLFKRNGLCDAFDSTADSITQTVLPFYSQLETELMTGKSNLWRLAEKLLHKDVKLQSGSWIQTVQVALRNIVTVTPEINKRVQRNFENNISAEGLSYKEANLIQLAASLEFYASYARTLLRAVIICEANEGKDTALRNFFTPNDIKWITQSLDGFSTATKVLIDKPSNIIAALDTIPDVLVDDEDGVGTGLYNAGNTDPLVQEAWSATDNPFHRIGIWAADRAQANLEAAKEEANALEYHILALKQTLNGGGNDPLVQKQIDYHENRLKKMRYDIRRKEEADA